MEHIGQTWETALSEEMNLHWATNKWIEWLALELIK